MGIEACKVRNLFLRVPLLFLAAFIVPPMGHTQGVAPDREYILDYQERYGIPQVPLPDLGPIVNALREGRFEDAIEASEDILRRADEQFSNLAEASWVKSEALTFRAEAHFRLTGDQNKFVRMLRLAGDAGNLRAIGALTEYMWRKLEGDPEYATVEATPAELRKYLRVGAELGNIESALAIGSENLPVPVDRREKVYWSLLGLALAVNDPLEVRRQWINTIIERVGEHEVEEAFNEHSLLPARTLDGPEGLPGRDLIATIYSDATLRREYGYSYGRRAHGSQESPSTREVFKAIQVYANVLQDVEAFLLVTGSRRIEDPSIIAAAKPDILAVIGPSDSLFVRCGPIAHVAMVHHVDKVGGKVYFADGLFQFWQLGHNPCISDFELVPFTHGGFLAAVPMDELGQIVEAVVTLRNRQSK